MFWAWYTREVHGALDSKPKLGDGRQSRACAKLCKLIYVRYMTFLDQNCLLITNFDVLNLPNGLSQSYYQFMLDFDCFLLVFWVFDHFWPTLSHLTKKLRPWINLSAFFDTENILKLLVFDKIKDPRSVTQSNSSRLKTP